MRAAAAAPSDATAQPSELTWVARWCVVKNTALRTTVLAARVPRFVESTGATSSICA